MMIAYYIATSIMVFVMILSGYYRFWGIAVFLFLLFLISNAFIDMKLPGSSQDIYYARQFHDGKYRVIYANSIKEQEIYILLDIGHGKEPLYVSMPYTDKREQQMKDGIQRSRDNNQPLMFDMKVATEEVNPKKNNGDGTVGNGAPKSGGRSGNNIDSNPNALRKFSDPFYTEPPPKVPDKQIPSYAVPTNNPNAIIYQHHD